MSSRYVEDLAQTLGLHVSTWSPGDGVTRYRFFRNPGNHYYGPDDGIKTVVGRKDAVLYLEGFKAGMHKPDTRTRKGCFE